MMRIHHSPIMIILVVFSAISVAHGVAHAGGFGLDEQGAAAMGRANAFAAQADDPTALFYNPAGIGQLHGTQLSLGTTLISPSTTFESASSTLSTDTTAALFYPPTLYVAHEIRGDLHVGLGVFTPFGLSTEWPSDWEGRYLTTFSAINTYYLNPSIVWSPSSRVHVAAGISYVPSSVTLRSKLELSPAPDGDSEIKADGDGWGYNLALLAALPARSSIGLSFRSAVKVDYTGNATFSPLGLSDGVRSSLTFPPILTIGVANHPSDQTVLEVDLQWVGWSSIDKIAIDFSDPAFPFPDVETPKNWKDSYSLRLGAERSSERLALRAGYAWDVTPIPSETIDPSLPDSDKHTFAIGMGYRFHRAKVDLAYMYIVSKDRNVANTLPTGGTPFDHRGKYSTQTHEVGIGFTYSF